MEEKQYTAVEICTNPKTVIYIDKALSEEEKAKRISKYLDDTGKLKIDTVAEYSIHVNKIENNEENVHG